MSLFKQRLSPNFLFNFGNASSFSILSIPLPLRFSPLFSLLLPLVNIHTSYQCRHIIKFLCLYTAISTVFTDLFAYLNPRESNIWLSLGGFQEKGPDDSHLYNTHVLIDETGNIRSTYRKIHLFDVDVPGGMVYKESSFSKAGKDIVAADSPIGRLGLTVCYDLRFPDLYQQLRFQHKAQVLLVPSAFTKVTGEAHWEILLRSRAIETQCYVIAAAQAGWHNDKRESYGDTLIIDPWGKVVSRLPDRSSTGLAVADIDFSLIDSVRTRMPISEHRKPFDFWKCASQ